MQVFRGIHKIGGDNISSNIYLIDGEIVVDTGTGNSFPGIKSEILGIVNSAKNIRTIINTHYHFDHTGGNKKFRDWIRTEGSDVVLAIHKLDREFIERGDVLSEIFGAKARAVTANLSLEDGDILETEKNGFRFEVIHTPGHTPGSICLYESGRHILISGDTIFDEGIGRTDLPGGNDDDMNKSLRKISKLDIEYLFPGHGNVRIGGIGFLIKQALAGGPKFLKND